MGTFTGADWWHYIILAAASGATTVAGNHQPSVDGCIPRSQLGANRLPVPPIGAAEICVRSELTDTDRMVSGRPVEDYTLRLEENDLVVIKMDSLPNRSLVERSSPASEDEEPSGFDTYLEIRRADSNEVLAYNDDREDDDDFSLNSRIAFTASSGGEFVVRARPYSSGRGEYALRLTRLPPAPPPTPMEEDRATGIITPQSPESGFFGGGYRFARHSFSGRAGERLQLTMSSGAVASGLQLIGSDGNIVATGNPFVLEEASLVAALPADGRYLVQVDAEVDSPTPYTLRLERAMAAPREAPADVRVGQNVLDGLSIRSAAVMTPDGQRIRYFYKLFALPVQRARTVVVTMNSRNFPPALDAGLLSVLGFSPVTSNSGSVTGGARLVIEPHIDGTVYLRARSLDARIGEFQLQITYQSQEEEGS